MTALTTIGLQPGPNAHQKNSRSGFATVVDDMTQGLVGITHNGFALLGLVVVFAIITLTARPDLRDAGEVRLMSWLQERRDAVLGLTEPDQGGIEIYGIDALADPLAAKAITAWLPDEPMLYDKLTPAE